MTKIGDVAQGRDNNFNLLRYLAALAVLVAHSVGIAGGPDYLAWWDRLTGYTLGQVAVSVFFALSGFLITKSWCERRSWVEFAVARVLRLMPALLVCLALSVFVLGPLVTDLPVAEYFRHGQTWSYLAHNAILMAQRAWQLPGVFVTLPDPTVNGSLWTLRWEVACYALVVVAGGLGLLRPRLAPFVWLVPLVAVALVPQRLSGILAGAALLTLPFATGGLIYLWRDRVPLDGRIVLALFAAVVGAAQVDLRLYLAIFAVAVSYAGLWFGFARIPYIRRYNRVGDYSYGLYIYAWPVQQLVALWLHVDAWVVTLIATPLATLCAVLSWRLVEQPALARRRAVAATVARLIRKPVAA